MIEKYIKNGTNPCWKCEDRTEDCHGKCKEYQEWQQLHVEAKLAKRAKYLGENEAENRRWEAIHQAKKRRNIYGKD